MAVLFNKWSGRGNAGNIFLDVRDTITVDGFSKNRILPSIISAYANNGNAGNIDVKTGSLFLTNGGFMAAFLIGQNNDEKITTPVISQLMLAIKLR